MSDTEYSTSGQVIEVRTPTSSTRFHDTNDKVDFEREKYEAAKQERNVQALHAILPNPRCRR